MDKSKNLNTSLPTLSVLIVNYNDARFISETLESVLTQSYKPKEIIVIDNASTDNSAEIIQKFGKHESNIRFIKNAKNMGILYCYDQFLGVASGEYFQVIGAHDKLLPGFFEKSMKLLARYPEAGVCSTLAYLIDEKGKNKGFFVTPIVSTKECFIKPETAMSIVNKIDGYIPGHTAICKRTAFETIGGLIPEMHAAADAFALKVIVCKYGACFIPEALVCIRTFPNSYSKRISKDLNCNKEIWQVMEPLLTNNYKKYFTKKHVEDSRKTFSYIINSLTLSNLQNKEIDFIKEHMPPKRFLERILFLLFKLIAKLEKLIYHLYTFVYSKRSIYPVIYNRFFRTLHFRLLYFVSKIRRKMSR